jgi:hypothetical protein
VAWLNGICLFSCSGISSSVEAVVGELFKMSSTFLSASICSNPFMLFFFLLKPVLGHLVL